MKLHSAFFLIAALTLLSGCDNSPPPAAPTTPAGGQAAAPKTSPDKPLRIAVIPKGESHEFWKSVRAGALQAGKKYNVEVTFKGPQHEGDTSDQIAMVQNKIAEGVDGICLAPVDAVALRVPVEQAIAAGIPVIIFDSGLTNLDGVVSFVATDNYKGGTRAAEHLAKLLGGKGSVILMRYNVGSQSTEAREKGFLDKIEKYPDIKMLVKDKNAGPNEEDSVKLAENLLSNYGDKVDGIFCPNQPTTSGMLTVLTTRFPEVAKKVKFVGFDAGTNISAAVEKGQMHGTIVQDPVKMGFLAVELMKSSLRKDGEVKKNNPVPEELATPENAKEEAIHALLHPEAVK
ncbi:MAG: substrate-binding domain-containing protein [Planctomycetia bacterium]|nr:substrate-binding domain-containing protein [Planctomycetia bacterium]